MAIDIEFKRGIIDVLRNEHVADALQGANGPSNLGGGSVCGVQIVAADLHVDGRGQARIDYCVHEAPGLKVRRELRQIPVQALAHAPHILIAANLMSFLQTSLHERRVRSGVRRVDGREIRSDADVRDDHAQL